MFSPFCVLFVVSIVSILRDILVPSRNWIQTGDTLICFCVSVSSYSFVFDTCGLLSWSLVSCSYEAVLGNN